MVAADFDMSEVFKFANDMGKTAEVLGDSRKAVRDGAQAIKSRLQSEASGLKHAPGLPAAITFDMEISPDGVQADIGPVTGGAGSLALLYYGNSRTGPVLPDPQIALDAEAENVADALGKVGEDGVF